MMDDEEVWTGSADEPNPKEDWYLPDGAAKQCVAKSKASGKRCKKAPILGGSVCRLHGGAAPQVKAKAAERLLALIDPALVELGKILRNAETSDADRLRAISSILDRGGIRSGVELEVSLPGWQEVLKELFNDNSSKQSEVEAGPTQKAITAGAQPVDLDGLLAEIWADDDAPAEPVARTPQTAHLQPTLRPRSPSDPRRRHGR